MDAIDVANSALSLLGARRLTSFADGSELAAKVNLRFALTRDSVLELNPWNFASVRMALTRDAETPAFTWAYAYHLPTDPYCLVVRDTDDEGSGWEVGLNTNGQRVIFHANDSLSIRYTARVADLNIWHATAVLALTYLLAADLAQTVTGHASKAEGNRQLFELAIRTATTVDGREGSPVVVRAPTTLSAIRWGSV